MSRLLLFSFLLTSAASAQDLDIRFSFSPDAAAEVDETLSAMPGVQQAYELDIDGDGWTERLLLSFTPRDADAGRTSLNAFVAETQDTFLQRLPDRQIRAIALDLDRNPLADAALPYAAFAFFRPVPEGAPKVCDSAALFFESDAGFWTLSWNAPRGWLRGELDGVFSLLSAMEIVPAGDERAGLAVLPSEADPVAFDRSRLAQIR